MTKEEVSKYKNSHFQLESIEHNKFDTNKNGGEIYLKFPVYKDDSKKIDQNMKSLISTSEYFDKSAINIFSGPTVQDILFCSLKSSAVRIVAKLDLLCGRIRGGLDFRIFDLRISHLIFIWISMVPWS